MGREAPDMLLHRIATALYYILFAAFVAVVLLLVGTLVPFAGYQARVVATGSMAPTMPIGSAVFIRAQGSYKPGDIITFQRAGENMPTTHRIISDSAEGGVVYYATRGDANSGNDQRSVAQNEVLGRVFLSVPYLGFVIDFLRKPLGFVALVGLPAALVIWEEGRKVFAAFREKRMTEAHTL